MERGAFTTSGIREQSHAAEALTMSADAGRDLSMAPRNDDERRLWLLAAAVALPILLWVVVVYFIEGARFVVLASSAHSAQVEVASSLARLFAALVLLLFPEASTRLRLHWIAGGLVVLGLGGLVFGSLYPLIEDRPDLNTTMYGALIVRGIAGLLFAIGLLPVAPLRLSPRLITAILVAVVALCSGAIAGANLLPPLIDVPSLEVAARNATTSLNGLTGWHWALSIIPLTVAIMAVVGSAWHVPGAAVGGWLVVAMVLWAGAQLHGIFWPSAYSSVMTTGNLLRLAFSVVVAVGGILELRRIAAERAALLAVEQEASSRLADLAILRTDFSSMVAHELGSPIAAILRSADLLASEPLSPGQAQALATIRSETRAVNALVTDVQAIATIDRGDFDVYPLPVSTDALVAEAAAFAEVLPGEHPFTTTVARPERVRADAERICQVLRNLLSNAAKYSASGTPIELRVARRGDRVRLEVADQGYGIPAAETMHIFEKYARGGEEQQRGTQGAGLGLYLSRRIIEAHGSELTVESTPGAGSVFGFDLEVVG